MVTNVMQLFTQLETIELNTPEKRENILKIETN